MDVFLDGGIFAKILRGESFLSDSSESVFAGKTPRVLLDRAGLLTLLGLASLPPDSETMYPYWFSILASSDPVPEETVYEVFDHIFAEHLTQTQKNFSYETIIQKISEIEHLDPIADSVIRYRNRLLSDPYRSLHDLIFYVGWEKTCITVARLLEELPSFPERLLLLRNCVIDSFEHIQEKGETVPSFFRLIEVSYAYRMREEHLSSYSPEDWEILCKGSLSLQPRDSVVTFPYIDACITREAVTVSSPVTVITSVSDTVARAALALTRYELIHLPFRKPYTLLSSRIFFPGVGNKEEILKENLL